jgi:hypothetical protein
LGLGFAAGPAAALVCGESIESTIAVLGEVDTYTFQASAGDVMSVSVGGPNRFSAFGVAAELRSPTNQIVNFRKPRPEREPALRHPSELRDQAAAAESGTYARASSTSAPTPRHLQPRSTPGGAGTAAPTRRPRRCAAP